MTTLRAALDRTGYRSLAAAAGGLLVLTSVVASTAARAALGESVRVRWTIEPSYHVGPEVLPTTPVLVAFPLAVAVGYLGQLWLGRAVARTEELSELVPVVDLVVLAVLATLVCSQIALVVANLAL